MKNLLISLMILLTSNCFAQDATHLNKNDPAPYEGIIFTIPRSQELRVMEIEHKEYKLLNDSLQRSQAQYEDILKLDTDKVNIVSQQNDNLAKSLEASRTSSEWTKILWFGLGVFATSAAIYGASKFTK